VSVQIERQTPSNQISITCPRYLCQHITQHILNVNGQWSICSSL